MRNMKALLILNFEKINIFKIRSKCITFVGIDHMYMIYNKAWRKLMINGKSQAWNRNTN